MRLEAKAPARSAVDRKCTARELDTLAHAIQTVPCGAVAKVCAAAIVGDGHPELAGARPSE